MKTILTTLQLDSCTITSLSDLVLDDIKFDPSLYPFIDALLSDQLELRQVSSIKDVPELNEHSNYFFVDKFYHNSEVIQSFARDWQEHYPENVLNLVNIEE
jgi:hypothetical protein